MPNHQLLQPANNSYVLGTYVIVYNNAMKVKMYSEPSYHGIIFYTDKGRYDVVNNYHMGPRLVINKQDGEWHDMPFKPATFGFLPEGAQAMMLEDWQLAKT